MFRGLQASWRASCRTRTRHSTPSRRIRRWRRSSRRSSRSTCSTTVHPSVRGARGAARARGASSRRPRMSRHHALIVRRVVARLSRLPSPRDRCRALREHRRRRVLTVDSHPRPSARRRSSTSERRRRPPRVGQTLEKAAQGRSLLRTGEFRAPIPSSLGVPDPLPFRRRLPRIALRTLEPPRLPPPH